MTCEEYLAFERRAVEKHEFHDGEIFAMAGVTRKHSQVAMNLGAFLLGALRGRPCEVHGSDMKVRIPRKDRYKYPDLSVACPARFEDETEDVLLNPTVLIEVLSPSTKDYDRQGKFADYRRIPSLREYVLIAQDEVLVEHYTRKEDDSWLLRELHEGNTLRLCGIGVEIPLAAIYEGVFRPEESP